MSKTKCLLKMIRGNHDLKITHDEIEKMIGNSIGEDEALDLYRSMGIALKLNGDFYEFSKINFLEKRVIKEKIDQIENATSIRLEVEEIIETTSRYFTDEDFKRHEYSLCFAEFQTQGRGRASNTWFSPFGSGICFSVIGCLSNESSPLGLSIYCGISLVRILRELGYEDVFMKWPNDLIHDGKKLGGILIELSSKSSEYYMFNIGIGVNHDLRSELNSMHENHFPPTDLKQIDHRVNFSRSEMSGIFAKAIIESLMNFDQKSMQKAFSLWPEFDALHQKNIKIIEGDTCIEGKNLGIDDTGALLLDQNGIIKRVYNGHLVA
ncbi:MAG: biotin--[acetyl-CoA-carboxylase] ligase [Candidatus Thioglobus sp.]|nr:biotin--[acetyl-CoA-carboxylase] ligase [Candidatus Thioglobus sp.]